MARSNIYVLRNLGVPAKLAISAGLLCGFAVFLSGWFVSVGSGSPRGPQQPQS